MARDVGLNSPEGDKDFNPCWNACTPDDHQRFENALRQFADSMASNFALPVDAQSEDQLKSPVTALLRECGEGWGC